MLRIGVAAVRAVAGSLVFQLWATLIAVLVTRTSGFGAPIAAGSAHLSDAKRPEWDPAHAAIDLAVTALVLCVPAYRSGVALGVGLFLGVAAFGAAVFWLPDATSPVAHAAWWIIAMLPALAVGLLPWLE